MLRPWNSSGAGRRAIAIPPQHTGQACCGCGERVERALSARTRVCHTCGLALDRDEHTDRNSQWAWAAASGSRGDALRR